MPSQMDRMIFCIIYELNVEIVAKIRNIKIERRPNRSPFVFILKFYASYSGASSSTVIIGSSFGLRSSICMDRATTFV